MALTSALIQIDPSDPGMARPPVKTWPRNAFAVVAVLLSASIARSEWTMIQPPITGQRDCEMVYDESAPISEWQVAWRPPFETLEACEAMLAEMIRRSTAPGRRERNLEYARREEETALAAERQMRRAARNDPELKRLLRVLPKPRKGSSRICQISVDVWTNARCIERLE